MIIQLKFFPNKVIPVTSNHEKQKLLTWILLNQAADRCSLAYVPGVELGIVAPPSSLYSSLVRSYCPKTSAAVQNLKLPFGS